ncbi:response regulator [Streptomyces anulatus]|uniref:response regulator n=1 Tax=Streptomyces anulatus TaxID=1892 RepID=UPI001D1970EE|nr:response regulator [Streptomyces anulatus]
MIDVLIVEDDFMVAGIHQSYVDRVFPFQVVGAVSTGEQALAAIRKMRPHLILLDLYLPDMFGLDIIPRLRGEGHNCDIMVISASRNADEVRNSLRQGVVNFLLKPFEFEDLSSRLLHYAAQRESLLAAVVRDQSDIDRALLQRQPQASNFMLPKGMSAETAKLVESALRDSEENLSAAECAALTGLSRVSARRYLEHFHDAGRVDLCLRYGSPGRPERRYQWIT